MQTNEEHDKIAEQVSRIEDMLIVILNDTNFVDRDLFASAKARLFESKVLVEATIWAKGARKNERKTRL